MISLPDSESSLISRFVNLVYNFEATQKLDQDVLSTLIYHKQKKFNSFSEKFTVQFSIKNIVEKNELKRIICSNIIKNKVYMCFDCQIHRQAFLCEDCFNQVRHDLKCHFTVKQLPEQFHGIYKCCCGDLKKMSYRGTCHQHKRAVQKAPNISMEDELIIKYITQCFQLYLILKYNEQVLISNSPTRTVLQEYDIKTISHKYLDSLVAFIRKVLLKGYEYTPLVQKSLLSPISIKQFIQNSLNFVLFKQITKDETILSLLLKVRCVYAYQSYAFFDGLIEDCIKYQSFEYISQLVRQSSLLLNKYGNQNLMKVLNLYKKEHTVNTELYCAVLCSLAQKNILVSKNNYQKQTLSFYYDSTCPNDNLQQKNKQILNLVPCWKQLRKQKIFTIQNILKINKSHLLLYLMLTVQDEQLFTELLSELIILTANKIKINEDKQNKLEKVQKMNISQICNVISKLLTAFTKGKTLNIKQFLIGLKLDGQFCKIAFYYLYESIQKITNLGGVTLEIFSRYLQLLKQKRQEEYQKYCGYWKNTKIQQQKFIEYSSKIINILIGQQLKSISKTLPYMQHKPLQLQSIQQKKLKEMLYMNKVISKKQLSYLAKQKCLNFDKARQIVKQYTKYDNKNNNFVYSHQENYFCYDGIINNIFGLDFVEEVMFQDGVEDNKFSTQLRKEAILGLLAPIFQQLSNDFFLNQQDIQKFKILTKNHSYTKWFCLVAIDKIVNGEIPNLRMSILNKRQQLYKSRKPKVVEVSQEKKNLYYLLSVDLYNQDKVSESSEKIVIVEEKIKQQQTNEEKLAQKLETNIFKYFQSESSGNQSPQKQKTEEKQIIQSPAKSQNQTQSVKMSKKLKLIQKLLAKGSKVLTKHNLHEQKIQLNRQNCLICKQHGNPQNSLFYLGNLMKIDPRNIFFEPGMNSTYTINLCMHVICEKCFQNTMKSTTTQCPLCKKVSNIIFPFLGNAYTEQSRRFVENRMSYSLILAFNEYHADECFILILKSFISEKISGIFLKIMLNQQKERQTKKIQYYEQFLTNYWNSFEQYEKQYYLVKIQRKIIRKQQNLINNNKIQPKKLIDRILSQVFIGRLIKRYSQDIWKLLDLLEEQVNEQQYDLFISEIEKVMETEIKRKQKSILNVSTRKKLVQHYFKTPKTVAEVDHKYQTCSKCKNISNQNMHCIICNTTYCKTCKHAQVHGNLTLSLNCATKMLEYNTKNGVITKHVFANTYKDPWTVEHYSHDDYFDYQIDEHMFNLSVYEWLENVK